MRSFRVAVWLDLPFLLSVAADRAHADEFGRPRPRPSVRREAERKPEEAPSEPAPVDTLTRTGGTGSPARAAEDPIDQALREALEREKEWPRPEDGPPKEPTRGLDAKRGDGAIHLGLSAAYWLSWVGAFGADPGPSASPLAGTISFAQVHRLDSTSDSARAAAWIFSGPFELRISGAYGVGEGSAGVIDTFDRKTLEYRIVDAGATSESRRRGVSGQES